MHATKISSCVDSLFRDAMRQFSAKEIAEQLYVQYGTVDRWIRKKTVPPFYRNDLLRILGMTDSFDIGIKESDQFYTFPVVAKQCIADFKKALDFYNISLNSYKFIEPSAGCGSFYNFLPPMHRIGIDIDPPKNPVKGESVSEIQKADFLQWQPKEKGKYIAIGNPPFGRNGKTALDFVVKAFEFSDYVGFILPPIFNSTGKGSCRNRLTKLGYAKLFNRELNGTSFFCPDGRNVGIKTVFQVWAKNHPQGYKESVIKTCNEFVAIHNIYISPKIGRPSSHPELAGHCDIYIPRSFWGTRPIAAMADFADIPYQDGYGIIVKKQKREILKFIRGFDWRSVAHVSTNGSMSLRRDIISAQLVKAGFMDTEMM